jgi:TIR domain
MAHDVFICHSAKDKTTADAVCAMLESNGIRCWIAPRDVTAGMEWSECIIDAIEECRVMVLVFTTNANESPQIRREVERAVNRGVAILPLRIEDILPGRALEYFIGNVHWLDAMTPPLESHLQNLAGTVKILLGRLPQHVAPMPHAATPQPPVAIPRIEPTSQKVEWAEPPRTPLAEPAPPEIFRTPPAFRAEPPQITPAPTPEPARQQPTEQRASNVAAPPVRETPAVTAGAASKIPATGKLKRPVGVTVVAVLDFIFAGSMMFSLWTTSNYERNKYGILFVLLVIAGVATGYGLLKLKKWGHILGILLPCAGIGWLISAFADAYRDTTGIFVWLILFAFFCGIVMYLVRPKTRAAFVAAGTTNTATQVARNFGDVGSATPAARNVSSELFARGTGRRPTPVLVIAILSFVEAGIWIIPIYGDFDRNHPAPRDFGAFLLVLASAAIGFGLIKLMGWARLLKVVVAAVDAVLMISVAQEAFHEGGFGEFMWIIMFIYIIWSALFMFTPKVKRAFSKTA